MPKDNTVRDNIVRTRLEDLQYDLQDLSPNQTKKRIDKICVLMGCQ